MKYCFTKKDIDPDIIKKGEELINNCLVIILSGGHSSRFSTTTPKSIYTLPTINTSILECLHSRVSGIYSANKVSKPRRIIVITNDATHEIIKKFIIEKNLHLFDLFTQPSWKFVNDEGADIDHKAPNGNGSVFNTVNIDKYLEDENFECEYINILGADNILARPLDSSVLGLMDDNKLDICSKSVDAISGEQTGLFGITTNHNEKRMTINEYIYDGTGKNTNSALVPKNIDKLHSFTPIELNGKKQSNICNHYFSLEAFKKLSKMELPIHYVKKIIPNINQMAYKKELFIFDSFDYFDKIGMLNVSRFEEFTPLKKKSNIRSCVDDYLNSEKLKSE